MTTRSKKGRKEENIIYKWKKNEMRKIRCAYLSRRKCGRTIDGLFGGLETWLRGWLTARLTRRDVSGFRCWLTGRLPEKKMIIPYHVKSAITVDEETNGCEM